jgi:hypothetical protein
MITNDEFEWREKFIVNPFNFLINIFRRIKNLSLYTPLTGVSVTWHVLRNWLIQQSVLWHVWRHQCIRQRRITSCAAGWSLSQQRRTCRLQEYHSWNTCCHSVDTFSDVWKCLLISEHVQWLMYQSVVMFLTNMSTISEYHTIICLMFISVCRSVSYFPSFSSFLAFFFFRKTIRLFWTYFSSFPIVIIMFLLR